MEEHTGLGELGRATHYVAEVDDRFVDTAERDQRARSREAGRGRPASG
jgi:hypothetical protein